MSTSRWSNGREYCTGLEREFHVQRWRVLLIRHERHASTRSEFRPAVRVGPTGDAHSLPALATVVASMGRMPLTGQNRPLGENRFPVADQVKSSDLTCFSRVFLT